MKRKLDSISELRTSVVNVFDTIASCKDFANSEFGYGFIARSIPNFRAPKATAKEWMTKFDKEMPNIVKVTKVTNARAFDYEKVTDKQPEEQGTINSMKGFEWVIPNIIKRATKDGGLQLCLTFKENDQTKFETFYIVADHFATADEIDFINTHTDAILEKYVTPTDNEITEDKCVKVLNYRFSNLIAVGTTLEIEEIWDSVCKKNNPDA